LKIIYGNNSEILQQTIDKSSAQELFLFSIIKEYYSQLEEILTEKKISYQKMICSIENKTDFININIFIDTEQEIKIIEEILDHAYDKCSTISIIKHGKIIEYGLKFAENEL